MDFYELDDLEILENKTREFLIQPRRGIIYDRNGEIIVNNIPSYNLIANLAVLDDIDKLIEDIQKIVVNFYDISFTDFLSARRSRHIARPRQIAMYLSKKLTTKSLPEIGRKFTGRDHTTVIHAIKKIEDLMHNDKKFALEVQEISNRILKK